VIGEPAVAAIELVPIFLADRRPLVSRLAAALQTTFGAAVAVRPPRFDPERAYDSSRGQYHATLLLEQLLAAGSGAARVVGVTGVDLFVPILTYVFGEAQLEGPAAVVSLHRLRPEVYGLPPDDELLAARLEKEAIHELGHTFGLQHCRDPACVMRASTYVEEIDLKSARFCERCEGVVRGTA
jgi:archaemetzincin